MSMMQKQQCETLSYPTQQPIIEQQQVSFIFNRKIIGIIFLTFAFLYMSLQQHRAKYFVFISLVTNVVYPLFRMQKQTNLTIKRIILQGTLVAALLYDLWTLLYPHKVFIYYIPQLVGAVGKIYHLLTYEQQEQDEIVQELIKFQSKTQVFVIIYSAVYFILRLKYSWWKFMKLVLLFVIVRVKYSMHYGTRVSYREIHFVLDRYSRYFNLRRYYQIVYLRLSVLGGGEVDRDGSQSSEQY